MSTRFALAVVVMILAGVGAVAAIWHGAWFTASCSALVFVIAMVRTGSMSHRRREQRSAAAKAYRPFYNTKQWKALRLSQLMREPLCKRCADRGVVRAATVAHHKVAHKGDAVLFFDAGNLASSCDDCHNTDEQRIERGGKARQTLDADGWPCG